MVIFGFDPGYHRVGWGAVEKRGGQLVALDFGCVETDKKMDLPERLQEIHAEALRLLKKHRPNFVVIEKIYFAQSVTTALKVSEARGVLLLATAELKIPVMEISSAEVKKCLTGFGGAKKYQMQEMVRHIFSLREKVKSDDAADALAMAYAGACRVR